MDSIDEQILNRIEREFPVSPYPYQDLARDLGLDEKEVIHRISRLKENGVVLRIGAFFDSGKLGFKSTLIAMKVPQSRLEEVAEMISRNPGVTHNYSRHHEFNLWFVLMAKNRKGIVENLMEIKKKTGISQVLELPKRQLFKLNLNFTGQKGSV